MKEKSKNKTMKKWVVLLTKPDEADRHNQVQAVDYNTIVSDLFKEKDRLKMEKIQNAVFEDEKVKEHVLVLQTGEDAIKFFAKYGNSTPIKFINCYQDKNKSRRPYDLIIEHDIQKIAHHRQYYTVSPTGIVRVYNNLGIVEKRALPPSESEKEKDDDTTEFISLSDWMKESTQFNIVSNIHFFKNYSMIKLLTFWRSNVKFKKFIKIRENLVKKVFFCKPVFVDRIMAINQTLQQTHQHEMVSFGAYVNKQIAPEIFMNEQRACQQRATGITGVFVSIYEKIIGIIEDTIKKLKENKNEKLTSELEKINFGKQIKQKAIYLQKQEKQIKKLRDMLAKEDYEMRREFIRLINYMSIENLVKAMNHCLTKISDEVRKQDRGGLFITVASFSPNTQGELSLVLSVTSSDIIQNFDKIFKDIIDGLKETQKSLIKIQLDTFKNEYTGNKNQSSGPDIENIIKKSVIYNEVSSNVNQQINDDFNHIANFVKTNYSSCKDLEQMSKGGFDPHEWKKEKRDLSEIDKKISDWKKYKLIKDSHIKDQGKGIFFVDSRGMSNSLKKYIEDCQDVFLKKLKQFYIEKADQTFAELSTWNDELDTDPEKKDLKKLKVYTEFIKSCDSAVQRLEFLIAEKKLVADSLKSLNTNKVKLDSIESLKHEEIIKEFKKFEETLENAKKTIEEGKEERTKDLEEEKEANNLKMKQAIEDLQQDCLCTISKDVENNPSIDTEIDAATEALDKIKVEIDYLQKKSETLDDYSKRIKKDKKEPTNHTLKTLNEKFTEKNKIWRNLKSYESNKDVWLNGDFLRLKADEVEKTYKQYETDVASADAKRSSKDAEDQVLRVFKNRLVTMKEYIPLIVSLGNQNLQEEHWREIFENLDEPAKYRTKKDFSLNDLLADQVMESKDKIEEISARASGEARIKNDLNEIRSIWEETSFVVKPYNDSKDKFILSETEPIFQQLDDHQSKIQSMLAMKFVVNIRGQVEEWENKLAMVQNSLEEWLECQRNWMYLENIFGAEDIQRELPGETSKFMGVDKFWKDTMARTNQKPNVVEAAANKDIYERFQDNNKILDHVQKLLEDYLEKKRKLFPRFYFLTNDQLLEILSQTRNPHAVQPHLQKCFDNIKRIRFTEGQDSVDITAMISADPEAEPEVVKFYDTVKAVGLVEGWLRKIEEAMIKALQENTRLCLKEYPQEGAARAGWFFRYPAQCVLAVDMIMWTSLVETAILRRGEGDKEALSIPVQTIRRLIEEMVSMVKTDLSVSERETIKSIIVLEVHNRDVTDNIVQTQVDTLQNFEWAKQLRYYYEVEEEDVFARQTNTRFRYGYEYLGNGTRLVITPLTDKCYMTLTGAMHLNYGGAPEGPAGTGKTETTKDLAKSLAIQCIVFNCGPQMDVKMMGRFFSGLAQCGAWACFDEFNRIGIEVLSVIAQQIVVIQNGIRDGKSELEFEEKMISINPRFGVFITMNPGYAGRTELPDNLKALFRPVAMMIPDYALIAEIILFSEGFGSAKVLSRKMVYLYQLSSEQLSKQKHYDFGMRAVKSVLVMAGSLRRKVPREEEESKDTVELEAEVLLKAMRDSNIPKFLVQDLPLFNGIIQDLFPGKNVPLDPHLLVKEAIYRELDSKFLQKPDSFILKILQLLETMIVRHGVMTVGETGTGKSTLARVLAAALTDLSTNEEVKDNWFAKVQTFVLNPKSITEGELFGINDITTNTFTHGIVSKLVTQALEVSNDIKKWVWFDGPVDAGWIENMNTVLDDNKMLCLPDGKRIKLPTSFTMLFEVQDLLVASPATVSRCGMVFLEKFNLGYKPIIQTWITKFLKAEEEEHLEKERQNEAVKAPADVKKQKTTTASGPIAYTPPAYLEKIFTVIESSISSNMDKIRQYCKEEIASVDVNLVQSCLNLFEVLYREFKENNLHRKDKKKQIDSDVEQFLTNIFIFSFYWTIGGNLEDKSRERFNKEMREYFQTVSNNLPKGDLYNYFIDFNGRKFEEWKTKVNDLEYDPETPYFRILVDTNDTVRFKYLLQTMNKANHNVLLLGNGGVGKSVIVKDYLYGLKKEEFLFATTTFSAQTSSSNVQNIFLDKLVQRGRNLGPPSGKKMIFHFDDMNMPKLDLYGAQPPNELLRQIIDQGGFYDLKKHTFKHIKDCCIVASCSPPGGGRSPVTPRLFRHFHMLWMPDLSDASMELIFKSILKGFFLSNERTREFEGVSGKLIRASVEVYQAVRKQLLPTPSKSHYTFNLRDLSKVVQGILQVNHNYYTDANDLIRLWIHEESRIFHDRLSEQKDKEVFYDILLSKLQEHASERVKGDINRQKADLIIFSDIVDPSRGYSEVTDMKDLLVKAEKQCSYYNQTAKKKLELVFFTDALKHLCRITRVLKQPRGNCLLIGVGGSGRQSLTRIANVVCEYDFFMIEITKNYKEKKWREDLARLLMLVGKDDKKYTFLFSDTQIIFESFLEDINNILNTGEVPNMWKAEEIDQIIQDLRPKAAQYKREDTKESILELFVHLVRENLHICLTFSPIGDKLRERCRQFPSIIDCCTIDWFERWPDDALHSVAITQIATSGDTVLINSAETLSKVAVTMHNDVIASSDRFNDELKRKYYITPTSYLELLKGYLKMFQDNKSLIPFSIKRYTVGLEKLKETNEQIEDLQKKIKEFEPILAQKAKENEALKIDLESQNVIAKEVEKKVSADTEDAESRLLFIFRDQKRSERNEEFLRRRNQKI